MMIAQQMKKKLGFLSIILLISMGIMADDSGSSDDSVSDHSQDRPLDLTLGANFGYGPEGFKDYAKGIVDFRLPFFHYYSDLRMVRDGKYIPAEKYSLDHYFWFEDVYVAFDFADFEIKGGWMQNRDEVDTPYSIYLSSEPLPSLSIELAYRGDILFYESTWMRLNTHSPHEYVESLGSGVGNVDGNTTWREKGSNYKTFGINIGKLRIGFQDSITYLDRAFDPFYFLAPMPQYFIELFYSGGSKPWIESNNTNSLMGFFSDYTDEDFYVQAQILIDDLNGTFIGYEMNNLTKMAWSLGGWYQFDFGKFGFYHGGATKYTFAATYATDSQYSTLPYEHTYYPATEYKRGTEWAAIDYKDNYIGYKYGENAISILVDYENFFGVDTPWGFNVYSSLEWALNGSKSPANPWHEFGTWREIPEAIELLDDGTEHTVFWNTIITKEWLGFTFEVDLGLGGVFNKMALVEVNPGEAKIFRPQADVNEFVFDSSVTIAYTYRPDFSVLRGIE